MTYARIRTLLLTASLCLPGLTACEKREQVAPRGPPEILFVTVADHPATLTTQLPARTSAYETSDVRPQVDGLILARLFEEGARVERGQPLYRIDPAPLQAQIESAQAALRRSRAEIASTAGLARRFAELVKINAVAVQDFENAEMAAEQARADVETQVAALRSARINLNRTLVRAPISGRIGRSAITTGGLVTTAQASPLATIQRIDPIFVDIQQSSADLLRLRQQLLAGAVSHGRGVLQVRLTLEDGSLYSPVGELKFTDVTVDPATGSQVIRAVFPNPDGLLLPGVFVRAELVEGTRTHAMTVPQQAVSRNNTGQPTVLVVGNDGRLQLRTLTAPRTVGTDWLVTAGVRPGDRVVVSGAQNLQPGTLVKAVAYRPDGTSPARGD